MRKTSQKMIEAARQKEDAAERSVQGFHCCSLTCSSGTNPCLVAFSGYRGQLISREADCAAEVKWKSRRTRSDFGCSPKAANPGHQSIFGLDAAGSGDAPAARRFVKSEQGEGHQYCASPPGISPDEKRAHEQQNTPSCTKDAARAINVWREKLAHSRL
jgi:hypothetical protein